MPELPEVESVCRLMRRALEGRRIVEAEVAPDEIVLGGLEPAYVEGILVGRTVQSIGRKGKYWWIHLNESPVLFGHLGMAGWIREWATEPQDGQKEMRIREHGNAPLYDAEGRPRFMKLMIRAEGGGRIAMTDGRRLARLWVGESPETDERLQKLGRDLYDAPPSEAEITKILGKRTAPIKAILLDQAKFAGIGNWIADEVLYRAGIAPAREAGSLSASEIGNLRREIIHVLSVAVDVEADKEKLPSDWLFHHRWGGNSGAEVLNGEAIRRDTVGGRTTAWVPTRQV